MRIEKFDKVNLKLIQAHLTEALNQVAKQYDITIRLAGNLRFDADNFNVKIQGLIGDAPTSRIEAKKVQGEKDFKEMSHYYGIEPDKFGAEISLAGKKFKIVGLNPKARKNTILIQDEKGDLFSTNERAVKFALSMVKS